MDEEGERSVAVPVVTFPYWSSKHTETAGCRFCSGCYAAEEFRSAGGAPLFRRDCVFLHALAMAALRRSICLRLSFLRLATAEAVHGGTVVP